MDIVKYSELLLKCPQTKCCPPHCFPWSYFFSVSQSLHSHCYWDLIFTPHIWLLIANYIFPARKIQLPGAMDLASKGQNGVDINNVKPKEEVDDSFQVDMKVRCPCGSSLPTESMIQVHLLNLLYPLSSKLLTFFWLHIYHMEPTGLYIVHIQKWFSNWFGLCTEICLQDEGFDQNRNILCRFIFLYAASLAALAWCSSSCF